MVSVKSTPFVLCKSTEGLADGEFEAYAATFTAKDSYGDVMQRGSFDSSIKAWESRTEAGHVMPILWNHDTSNPHNNIGVVKAQAADDHGYRVRGQFDLDTKTGVQVYKLAKGGRVTQLSFAYDELKTHPVKGDPTFGDFNAVDDVLVHEVSVTPYGANRSTEFLAVKSALDAADITDQAQRNEVGSYLLKMGHQLLGTAGAGSTESKTNGTTEPPAKGHADNPPVELSARSKLNIERHLGLRFTE